MKPGDKIKVLLPADWLGVKSDEPNIWVNAVIKNIETKDNVTAYTYRLSYNHKYTVPVMNMQCYNLDNIKLR